MRCFTKRFTRRPCLTTLVAFLQHDDNTCAGVQVIDLGDTLEFEELQGASEDRLTCNVADVPTDSSNLVLRVSSLYISESF